MSKVIALTGMPASGKGEISTIAKERGWAIHRIGALVWAETERQGLDLTPSHGLYLIDKILIHSNK